jgi:YhcH/YjgK/YiaL family protein
MAVFGSLSTVRAQLAAAPAFRRAFDYVQLCLTPGTPEAARLAAVAVDATERIELGGGVFALEQAYVAKPPAQGRWEAHQDHIDVQVVVSGRELMGVIEVTRLAIAEDLRPAKDLMFYAPCAGGSTLKVGAGEVAVFYPADGHMPSLADGEPALVRKTVVKVPVAALKEAGAA